MITLDTSGLFAFIVRTDPNHLKARSSILAERGPLIIPVAILCEIIYLLERNFGSTAVTALLADIEAGAYSLDCGEGDLPRVIELVERYADFPLGFADASVIACAERLGGRVLTFDLRHFGVVACEGRIQLVP